MSINVKNNSKSPRQDCIQNPSLETRYILGNQDFPEINLMICTALYSNCVNLLSVLHLITMHSWMLGVRKFTNVIRIPGYSTQRMRYLFTYLPQDHHTWPPRYFDQTPGFNTLLSIWRRQLMLSYAHFIISIARIENNSIALCHIASCVIQ